MKDFLGVAFLFAGYAGSALLLAWLGNMPLDRALLFFVLYAVAQVRWFQEDRSPLPGMPRRKRSFMQMVRGE